MEKSSLNMGAYAAPASEEIRLDTEFSFLKTGDPPIGGGDNPGGEEGGDD